MYCPAAGSLLLFERLAQHSERLGVSMTTLPAGRTIIALRRSR